MRRHAAGLILFVAWLSSQLCPRNANAIIGFKLPRLRPDPLPQKEIKKALRILDNMGWNRNPVGTMFSLMTNPAQLFNFPFDQAKKLHANIVSSYENLQTKLLLDRIGPIWNELFPNRKKPSMDELAKEIGAGTFQLPQGPTQKPGRIPSIPPQLSRLLSEDMAYRLVQWGLWSIPDVTNYVALVLKWIADEAKESERLPKNARNTASVASEFLKYYNYYQQLVAIGAATKDAANLVAEARNQIMEMFKRGG